MDLLRTALVSLLSEEQDLEVIAALRCHDEQVVPVAQSLRPDVVVVDVAVAGARGVAMVDELRGRLPGCQIVALAAAKPAGLVQRLLVVDGVSAVDTNAPATRLVEAIRGAARGDLVVDINLAVAALAVGPNPLTPREMQVLQLVAEGASGSEIAKRLTLSPGTVRNYLSRAIYKTRGRTRVDAVRIAAESGWI
jgi:two-component system response regulator DesR